MQASDEEDLYLAQGYITASDRMWQMDLLRRTARGELSELLGPETFEEDARRRAYGFAAIAEASLRRASPAARRALEAYARGVNAYLAMPSGDALPLELRLLEYRPRPWQPSDSLLVGALLAESLSSSWEHDLARLVLLDVPQEKRARLFAEHSPLDVLLVGHDGRPATKSPPRHANAAQADTTLVDALDHARALRRRSLERVGLDSGDGAASNAWVVAGSRTASGHPLLANDPHLSSSAPGLWYLSDLSAPGLHVAGASIPGQPGIFIGHNDHIAWGVTNLGADVQDLYRETIAPGDGSRYRDGDTWRSIVRRTETVRVRKSASSDENELHTVEVETTRHGPIVYDGGDGSSRYALRWTALDPESSAIEWLLLLDRSNDWTQFRAALAQYAGVPLNFVYADVAGHIGYSAAGHVPLRGGGASGVIPLPGDDHDCDWLGFVPAADLPQLSDPEDGIIVSANNRVAGDDFPFHLASQWIPPYRAYRIHELLASSNHALTTADFRRIQGDTYSIPDVIFAREVLRLADHAPSSADWGALRQRLRGWDGRASEESRVLPLLVAMRDQFAARVIGGIVGDERATLVWNRDTFIDQVIQTRAKAWLPAPYHSYAELLLDSYRAARDKLQAELGPDERQWKWGDTGQVRFPHPLAEMRLGRPFVIEPLPISSGGSAVTVNAGEAVSMRFIADLSAWDGSQLGIPLGESGDPHDRHWSDQRDDWRRVTPAALTYSPSRVAAAARTRLTLLPAEEMRP